ncbi:MULTISPECIES: peroxidase family protein [unclassified Sphingopyxis]|uniref:peroxidase family protein n=1 Tax=unclassified Sphingopyxis TaxID=2614943 RepID=UPI002855F714|nr:MULTISPECIES: peroxidase family protein [unclassified Sphingopyxis]MDR7059755.1 Ca2+-binding RTX toxin-like protein [Sphingopyxis sp. BE235]MDR7180733.1 Ca2+-binding RTX toxin-like protein [Sphingopyxis sp. BE249]
MVTYIRSDLEFILDQIKIAEAHAAGQPLYGPGGLIPAYNLSFGLRAVDGSNNHLLPGQEQWGASNVQFPSLLDPVYRPADGTVFDPDGPGGAPPMPTAPNYNPSNNPNSLVFDSSLRTISNLLVDQTLGNPAAILEGLDRAGSADPLTDLAAITAIYQTFKPASDAEYQARVVKENARVAANELDDGDPLTPPSAAEQAALDALAAATAAHDVTVADLEAARVVRDAALVPYGLAMDGDNVHLPNVSPDVGLSASFNSWFTLFGQFFDHGLDLVNKGGSGTVFIPLQPDDPLYVPGSPTNFMVLTRATVSAGADNIMGTADDVRPVNTTTSYVDQNQTYASHASHQVFLRQYEVNAAGHPVATGKLIEGAGGSPGGMATWAEVKEQALMLGILLTDQDVGKVPLLRTDAYGNFIPNAAGYAQVITGVGGDGIPNTADDVVISGTPLAPVGLATAIRTNSAFLADIAHTAVPNGIEDGDITIGLLNPGNNPAVYDDELLDAHFMAGDGRVNENIGLTAVHHVFHAEHNRLVEHTKEVVLATGDLAFLNEWLADDVAALPTTPGQVAALVWDGERLFQAAKFGTEMQYQHLVFEEFARKIQPQVDFFIVPDGFDTTINPDIVAEFAHVVYRFGHSMLTEDISRFGPTFTPDDISLIDGFLNPTAFNGVNGVIADGLAAGDIIRGMTRQVGNEIDEFVTSALRNNLLGLPLDLATINLARGRDTGVPSLNAARREFYEVTNNDARLKPYESWVDFAGNLKNEASIINFVAAYGTHSLITGETTVEGKRAAAMAIIFGTDQTVLGDPDDPLDDRVILAADAPDAFDFLNGEGAWTSGPNGVTITGLDNVDLWIGGLAEKILPFGGMLGSTFNFVFEVQMEQLQNADRFYYLQRLDGLHLFSEMEGNSFAGMIMRNTNATHLPSDVFSTPGLILEVDRTRQFNDLNGDGVLESTDPTGGGILTPLVVRNNPGTVGPDTNYLRYTGDQHVVLGGTEGADIIIASEGDDTIFGDGGNDTLEGGAGNDIINAGAGDDVVRDIGGDDNVKLGDGHDVINTGPGLDLVLGGRGQDFIVLGSDAGSEVFAGEGNDFILGNITAERILGNEGDDWIEHGTFDGAPGDNFDEIFAQDGVVGHDVFFGLGGFDEFIAEGGDDIMVGSPGRAKMAGMSGWDWAIYKDNSAGTDADLTRGIVFDENPTPPPNATQDAYESVEGLSGSRFNDVLSGSNITAAERAPFDPDPAISGSEGYTGSNLDAAGIARIAGLQAVVGAGVTSYNAGDIILGGDGSDLIRGNAGDDIIDGDKWLNVRISVRQNVGPDGGTGAEIATANSMSELVTRMFNRTFNPGQLVIVREILTDTTAGDTDIAVFSDLRANYDITYNANGTISVAHARGTQLDGTDNLRNIERMRFSDVEIAVNAPATGQPVISDLTPREGLQLTVNNAAIADPNGLGAFSYQWQQSIDGVTWNNIAGATAATFTPDDNAGQVFGDQAGLRLRVAVSFTDGGGTAEQVISAATGPTGVNWDGNGANNSLVGTAGDDTGDGGGGNDVLSGNDGNDTLNGDGGNDTVSGGLGNDALTGGAGNDTLTGGAGNDSINGNGDNDVAVFAGPVGNYSVTTTGTSLVVTDNTGAEGVDTVSNVETLRFNGVNYAVVAGTAGNNNNLNGAGGAAGSQAVFGFAGTDTLNGGAGNDIVNGGDGTDTITQTGSTGGRDLVDGGAGTDTFVLNGVAGAETFRIYARAAAEAAGMTGLNANTEIVVTRNGTGNAQIVAELDNIEEINVNALNVTSPGGVPPGGTGGNGGDTILVIGDFNPTSLNFNTITVNGGRGADTVDISGLTSAHRLVFNTGGGADQFIGDARAQDVVNSGSSGNGHGGGSVHQQDNPLQMIRALMDDWMEANGRSSLRDVRHYFDTDYLFS